MCLLTQTHDLRGKKLSHDGTVFKLEPLLKFKTLIRMRINKSNGLFEISFLARFRVPLSRSAVAVFRAHLDRKSGERDKIE